MIDECLPGDDPIPHVFVCLEPYTHEIFSGAKQLEWSVSRWNCLVQSLNVPYLSAHVSV